MYNAILAVLQYLCSTTKTFGGGPVILATGRRCRLFDNYLRIGIIV